MSSPRSEANGRDIVGRLERVQKVVGGEVRWSRRGVPHLVLDDPSCSVCWFHHKKIFKLFWPYPSDEQKIKRFDSVAGVVEAVFNLGGW